MCPVYFTQLDEIENVGSQASEIEMLVDGIYHAPKIDEIENSWCKRFTQLDEIENVGSQAQSPWTVPRG